MRLWLRCVLAAIVWSAASSASAAFHLFTIEQIFSNASGTVQFVVLHECCGVNGENFWNGQSLTATGGGTRVFPFGKDLPSFATAGRRVLIATQGFAALNIVTPDFVVNDGFLSTGGGTINYADVDLVTYSALPTDGVTAITRNGAMIPNVATNFAGQSGSVTASGPPPAKLDLNQHGLTGSWFQLATSGQGIEIEFFPNLAGAGKALVQGAWFTFDTTVGGAERQRWYTFSGNTQSGSTSVAVTIFQNINGNFDAPPRTTAAVAGTGTLTFTDCSNAGLDYTFTDGSGRSGRVPLTRLTPNVTCTVGTTPTTNADYALSGNWFDATTDAQGLHVTDGQGFLFDANPLARVFFFAWYTYASAGQALGAAGQRWFTGQQQPYTVGSRTFNVTLFETTGGLFNQVTTPPPATVPVGTATVTFGNCGTATLQYNFTGGSNAGKSRTISLQRVGPNPPGCTTAASADAQSSLDGSSMAPPYGGPMMPYDPSMMYDYGSP